MASYRGVGLGDSIHMATVENPRRTQSNTYPGLDGVEELDQGFNGRITTVSGRIVSDSPADLGIMMNQFRSLNDGLTGLLIDSEGVGWPYAKLEMFAPDEGTARFSPPYGYTLRYKARFRHVL